MNCKEFHHWLLTKAVSAVKETPDAMAHLKSCQHCKTLYCIDVKLEKDIESAFHQQEIPNGLYDQIELTLDHAKKPFPLSAVKVASLLTAIALVCFAVFMIFLNMPFRYQNLQQLSEKAVDRHLAGDTDMAFTADHIESAIAMMSRELKFNVILPDLTHQGYVLIGGRLCVLDKCKIAYLFYRKNQIISSLFIMDYGHLDFEMADGSRFSNDIKGFHTDIWKEKGQVYAMVY